MRVKAITAPLLALLAFTSSSSCSRRQATLIDQGVTYDLTRYLPVAEIHRPISEITFDPTSDSSHLVTGWNDISVSESGEAYCWTKGRNAVVEIPIITKTRLTLTMDLEVPRSFPEGYRFPRQSAKFLWNGHELKTRTLKPGRRNVALIVPQEVQHLGMNQLTILPLYWYTPSQFPDPTTSPESAATVSQAIKVYSIKIDHQVPPGPSFPPLVSLAGKAIDQNPNTVICYYFSLPQEPRLVLQGTFSPQSEPPPPSTTGVVNVALVDEHNVEHILLSRTLEDLYSDPHVRLNIDMRTFANKFTMLSFSYSSNHTSAEGPASSHPMRWEVAQITGSTPTLDTEDVAVARDRYNVLVILYDALRADYLEAYGHGLAQTPGMVAMGRGGTTFRNAFANSSWTKPSVASLFTSMYPRAHHVRTGEDSLPGTLPSLPEILLQSGYRTLGVVNNPNASPTFGFGRGFDQVHEIYKERKTLESISRPTERADYVWKTYIAPFLEGDPATPFFVYLHEIDPHSPYTPPPDIHAIYRPPGHSHASRLVKQLVNSGVMEMTEADIEYLSALYKGEITFMDRYLSRVLTILRESGLAENTLVVLLSDHGEEFLDHGRVRHGTSLYDELLRVPLVFFLPNVVPEDVRPQVSAELVDVAPTIMDILGLDIPAEMQGQSLLPYFFGGGEARIDRSTLAELTLDEDELEALRFRDWKVIRRRPKAGLVETLLFNVEKDPGESFDLAASELVVRGVLEQMMAYRGIESSTLSVGKDVLDMDGVDPEVVKGLRTLGYVD